ncbi:hypothetical protein [Neisseria arctica]|uniref:hypothetical protein n=1 Tax=Neisseria arctica TaxID=1470200 RepID=UPI000A48F70F|nr:hypothetical protein [Neisseria arctica]UOO87777.1 hypothetical protein LVJ86_04570 [Neisseria arctica]
MNARLPSKWLPLLLAVAIFMQLLDATILNTALPKMAVDLNVPYFIWHILYAGLGF